MGGHFSSWGRYPKHQAKRARPILWRSDEFPELTAEETALPYGNGRSYGDSCQNDGGVMLTTRTLHRFLSFDPNRGYLRAEAGVLLSEVLDLAVPLGWFLPVTPGTKHVTLGGAVANDVHGKNHHAAGTIGHHIIALEVLRSDGSRVACSRHKNADFYHATLGGLGLTGVILRVELSLKRIMSPAIFQETVRYRHLDEFFTIAETSDKSYEYTVAWLDCLARGKSLGRGLFMRGDHAAPERQDMPQAPKSRRTFPFTPPISLVNRPSLTIFNALYYRKQLSRLVPSFVHYDPFFYPLDGIGHWNRMYGPRGFLQYQCVIPDTYARDALVEMLKLIGASHSGSFLAVLKKFGKRKSLGMLSFPREGVTLALDFPNGGNKTLRLLDTLDDITLSTGGAVYPAKDARMSGKMFRASFPRWEEFTHHIDPKFSSSFWRRITER